MVLISWHYSRVTHKMCKWMDRNVGYAWMCVTACGSVSVSCPTQTRIHIHTDTHSPPNTTNRTHAQHSTTNQVSVNELRWLQFANRKSCWWGQQHHRPRQARKGWSTIELSAKLWTHSHTDTVHLHNLQHGHVQTQPTIKINVGKFLSSSFP